jgi:hypothetical protein
VSCFSTVSARSLSEYKLCSAAPRGDTLRRLCCFGLPRRATVSSIETQTEIYSSIDGCGDIRSVATELVAVDIDCVVVTTALAQEYKVH